MDPARLRLRNDAERILLAAMAGADPAPLVVRALARAQLPEHVRLLAIGKAAATMARAAYRCLQPARALVVAHRPEPEPLGSPLPVLLTAEHPVPGPGSERAGRAVREWLHECAAGDVVVCLLSGGGSALLSLPAPGLTLADLAATTRALLHGGVDIRALNAVRKHLDDAKGGRLALAASPATVFCFALSDVPGDDPATLASGPFTPDPSTFADALDAIAPVREHVPAAVIVHLERGARGELPESVKPGDPVFERVRFEVIGNNETALAAAAAEAERRGFRGLRAPALTGEAAIAGRALAARLRQLPPGERVALLAGGETTVTVHGRGRGGRNQELALAAAIALDGVQGAVLGSAGTDGVDGRSPAAGAIVDGSTLERLRALGIDAGRALALNDSFSALAAVGDALVTGPTGTNVMDVVVALRATD